ncbi:hypothetical protein ENBRE01_1368 [Enteropsectra breve]|nr:hypothetical protein ENBRE01_1368 [Enteropsectra breve]
MAEDKRDRAIQQEHEKIVKKLQAKIKRLEQQVEEKQIIIDALVYKSRAGKKRRIESADEDYEVVPQCTEKDGTLSSGIPFINAFDLDDKSEIQNASESFNVINGKLPEKQPGSHTVRNDSLVEIHTANASSMPEFVKQVKNIFMTKPKNMDFRSNYSFQKFIEYAEKSYDYLPTNKKISKPKNPMRQYVEGNLDKILKHIMDNINTLNLNQICSTLFLINSLIDYQHKLVIAHDIILEIDCYNKILFIFSALFNNINLEEDTLSRALKSVLYHQFCIASDIVTDEQVLGYLESIKDNFSLYKASETIWDCLESMLVSQPVFVQSQNKDSLEYSPKCIEHGFAIRMVCHYLDWDYAYNEFILEKLQPLVAARRGGFFVYLMGILCMNAYRQFGKDQSVNLLLQYLATLLSDDSETSIVSYLILNQISEADAERWLENNTANLIKKNYDPAMLKNYLLL